jgi:acyl-CoA synthetase (AMP-forming)/AMP-acid ligase II
MLRPVIQLLPSPAAVAFARDLARHGDRLAVVSAEGELTYRALADRVADTARRLGTGRRLVLVAGTNEVEPLVTYLAALSAGHPVLLVPGDDPDRLDTWVRAYDPDVVASTVGGEWLLDERRTGTAHVLHPDLALLLSTSGSTGSPKLVRLSHENLEANAESIGQYLGVRDTDRAATTLPLHYCYGLSVVNSHLARGAGLILTGTSVVDRCFWDLFRQHRGTTFAGVPYTFDLLDRAGFADLTLPHLRYVTQAGGRLAPDRVRRYAELGRRDGWDLVVMYGATEATARMAYLPPDLAAAHPEAIGVPIPGGEFRLGPLGESDGDDPGTGELVYTGPNVMLGYAETAADLALGRTVSELRTGDVARRTADGLYEVVGRRSRFVKIYGLRIDLGHVETLLAEHGVTACCVGADAGLTVAVEGGPDPAEVRRLVGRACGLPARVVQVLGLAAIPRLPNGKPDLRAITALTTAPPSRPRDPEDLCALFAEILDTGDVTTDSTFVSLRGDSLSYVEMSIRLEEALGRLPANWHTTPIGDLAASAVRPAARRGRALDTSVLVRAVAIVLVVGSHVQLFGLPGGAHLLFGLAGFNFARFHLTPEGRRQRLAGLARGIARIAVPSIAWITLVTVLTDDYEIANPFLLNGVLGSPELSRRWQYWFVEALVWTLLALAALLASKPVDRLERRHPFGFPLGLVALALLTRYQVVVLDVGFARFMPHVVFWLFALGWCAAKARTVSQRICVTVAILVTIPGFFGDPRREAIVAGGLVLLVWAATVRVPRLLGRVAGVLAASSLYIYLTHFQVFPYLSPVSPLAAVAASLAAGVAYGAVASRAGSVLTSLSRRSRAPASAAGTGGDQR